MDKQECCCSTDKTKAEEGQACCVSCFGLTVVRFFMSLRDKFCAPKSDHGCSCGCHGKEEEKKD